MFIETHSDSDITLTFIKSANVQVYPCGRRRSEEIDRDGDKVATPNDTYYFPFDPEARLNTEANNRKHSSLNGFTQTYLKGFDTIGIDTYLTIVLNGYLFKIKADTLSSADSFGNGIITAITGHLAKLKETETDETKKEEIQDKIDDIDTETKIYANILLEDVHLFSGFQNYYTSVLRNQSATEQPETSLDLLTTEKANIGTSAAKIAATKDFDNYYFSGLSFSTTPLVKKAKAQPYTSVTRDSEWYTPEGSAKQQIVSLCILEKVGADWVIHQPALLPKIEHGITEDSIIVYGDTTLKGNDKEFKVEGTTELVGNTAIQSNLIVADNINVGNPTEPAEDDNGGCIVAEKNITAEQNLIAGQNLTVGGTADITGNTTITGATVIKSSLAVGPTVAPDIDNAGTITAETHVETPTLNASESITTPSATITSATITTADAESATITAADIGTATITDTTTDDLTVNTKATIAEADIEIADITTLTGTTATIDDITGTNTVSSTNIYQAGYKVPIIELVQSGTEYQLKISRIGAKPQS